MTDRPQALRTTDERSIGELFGQLASDTGSLVRQEVRLAVVETKQNVKAVASASAWLVSGLAISILSVLVMVASAVLLLAIWVPPWAAAAIVAIVLAAIGLGIGSHGWSVLKRAEFAPEDSIESIKEDAEWLKEQIRN